MTYLDPLLGLFLTGLFCCSQQLIKFCQKVKRSIQPAILQIIFVLVTELLVNIVNKFIDISQRQYLLIRNLFR